MARKRDPYAEQAAAESLVRFGPEISALKALAQAAERSYADRVQAARYARDFSSGAVQAAMPQVQKAYAGAQAATAPAFAQGGGVEAQALQARMGEAQALAQSQLAARGVSAVEGFSAARGQALRDRRDDLAKIGERSADLGREIGAYTTTTAAGLRSADAAAQAELDRLNAQLGQSERNSIRSSGFDPDTGQPLPGGKADPNRNRSRGGGRSWVTPQQQQEAGAEIQRLLVEAREAKENGEKRSITADVLLRGLPASKQPVYETYTDENGKKKRRRKLIQDDAGNWVEQTVDEPGFEKAKSQLLAQAALDMAYDGHLSRKTQRLLQQNGVQIGPLGVTSFGQWLKTPEGQAWRRRQRGGYTLPTGSRPVMAPSRDQQPG